jgi:hypothetical protein
MLILPQRRKGAKIIMSSKDNLARYISTIIVYGLSVLALIPVIRYLLVYKIYVFHEWSDRYVWARVFFSGPVLLGAGIYLAIRYRRSVHGIVGVILAVLGIIWLAAVGIAIHEEAA